MGKSSLQHGTLGEPYVTDKTVSAPETELLTKDTWRFHVVWILSISDDIFDAMSETYLASYAFATAPRYDPRRVPTTPLGY
jgi:hypothetical protein